LLIEKGFMRTKWFSPFKNIAFLLLLALLAAGCGEVAGQVIPPAPTLSAAEVVDLHIVTGQLVFVPAYSEVISVPSPALQLSTTLAIHNTDLEHTIIIKSVRYYNTDGELVREFVDSPSELKPLATTGFVIESSDTSGGWGANFLVEWGAEQPVYEPIIEAVMVSTRGTEGVSFISEGRVISEQVP
jgi:hypothetical protein